MTTDRWLGATEFALLAGVSRSIGSRTLRAACDGKPWRGVTLTVRESLGRGPRGLRLEVATSSLPTDLLQNLDTRRDTAGTNHDGHKHNAIAQPAAAQEAGKGLSDAGRSAMEEEQCSANLRLKQKEANLSKFAQLPEHKRQRAEARFEIVRACKEFVLRKGLSRNKGLELFVQEYLQGRAEVPQHVREVVKSKLRARTLRRWIAAEHEHGLLGLSDDFGNRRGRSKLDAHPEIQNDVIGQILSKTILRPKQVYEYLRAKYPDKAKSFSLKTIERFILRWRADNEQIYVKFTNPDGWKNGYKVAFGSQSQGITELNQLWSLDDTKADLLCTDGRYSAIFLIDIYSRRTKILISKTVDAVAVGTLLRSAILAWGIPQAVLVDNGRVYCNAHIDGALHSLGSDKIECTPYASEEKGIVERVQGTFQRDLVELLPGFVGHSVADRKKIEAKRAFGQRAGDPLETFGARMTSAELQGFCNWWCESRYQHQHHSGLPINPSTQAHFTPWEMAVSWRGPVRTVAEERALDVLLLMTGEIRTVTKKGIILDRARYIHAALVAHIGKRVVVRPDPDDLGRAIVHAAESHEFICVAESADRAGISLKDMATEAAVAQKRFLRQARETVKEARKAAKSEDPAQRILQRDREAMAKVSAFPHRSIPHVTPGIEAASEAADALQESKEQQQKTRSQSQTIRPTVPDVEILKPTTMKIYVSRALRRALETHEIEWLERWYPEGVPENQVGGIAQRLRAPAASASGSDGPLPTVSGTKKI